MDTLAFGYILPTTGRIRDFHPLECALAERTFKLEDGRHRSTKMWYCRLYHILMLQHLDAWDLPPESPLKKLILDVA